MPDFLCESQVENVAPPGLQKTDVNIFPTSEAEGNKSSLKGSSIEMMKANNRGSVCSSITAA